jgi:dTDP-4-amino-4,6-dideoxygalactose transaminase
MRVPFLDLVTTHLELEDELTAVFRGAVQTASFVGGAAVDAFETEFASFCEARYCIGVSSGTDALRFALIANGIGTGDVVVTVPNTFIATTEAISQAGAHPEFVDVDEGTYTLDPLKLRSFLEEECTRDPGTGRTICKGSGSPVTAVIPVHLYGQMADMDAILDIAAEHNLVVIEDACQAHGAEYFSRKAQRWIKAGTMGSAAAFSFYPGKNLGACGEAGAVTTNDEEVARRCRMLREHGQSRKYFHDFEGYNGRLDAVQAGFLRVKLRHLRRWNDERRGVARRYDQLFATGTASIGIPRVPSWSRPVYHLYVVRVARRDMVQEHLAGVGVGTGIHYPVPLHLSPAYSNLRFRATDLHVAQDAAQEILSLPMFPGLSRESQEHVASELIRVTTAQARDAELPVSTT